jgi:hypothetical protein
MLQIIPKKIINNRTESVIVSVSVPISILASVSVTKPVTVSEISHRSMRESK